MENVEGWLNPGEYADNNQDSWIRFRNKVQMVSTCSVLVTAYFILIHVDPVIHRRKFILSTANASPAQLNEAIPNNGHGERVLKQKCAHF